MNDPPESDLNLHLGRSSWNNLLRVLRLCVPTDLSDDEKKKYLDTTGKEWTIGDFWDSMHELQTQIDKINEDHVEAG